MEKERYTICIRGHLALASRKSAASFLAQAQALAIKVAAAPESALAKNISQLRRAQLAFEEKNFSLLFRGELLEDIPAPAKRWLEKTEQISPQKPV